jgi:hypothetical protein
MVLPEARGKTSSNAKAQRCKGRKVKTFFWTFFASFALSRLCAGSFLIAQSDHDLEVKSVYSPGKTGDKSY